MVVSSDQELLTLDEAWSTLGVPVGTLRYWRRQGWIGKYRRGDNVILVDAADVRREIEKRKRVIREDEQP